MSKTRKMWQGSGLCNPESILMDLHGDFYPKGMDIAKEVMRKVGYGGHDEIRHTLLSAKEEDHGLSTGFKTVFGLTPDCEIDEGVLHIGHSLSRLAPKGAIEARFEVITQLNDPILEEYDFTIMREQNWVLPAVRIDYVPISRITSTEPVFGPTRIDQIRIL